MVELSPDIAPKFTESPEATILGELLARHGFTIATAESMTGGAVAGALVAVPGSSRWLAGGVVAYMSRVKFDLLGVRPGPVVNAPAARAMATGVARLLASDVAVATTGNAGPEPMEDQPVGTVWFGIAVGDDVFAEHRQLAGTPAQVREHAVRIALGLTADRLTAVCQARPDRARS